MERMGTASFCTYKTWPWLPPAEKDVSALALCSCFINILWSCTSPLIGGMDARPRPPNPFNQSKTSKSLQPLAAFYCFREKEFIWKLSINKVDRNQQLAKLRYWCNRWKQIGNGWAVISPIHEDKEREAAHFCCWLFTAPASFNLTLSQNPVLLHVQDYPRQSVLFVESCRFENAPGAPWVLAKGCLYSY